MRNGSIGNITGRTLKEWFDWLVEEKDGCCSLCFASDAKWNWVVCMGWSGVFPGNELCVACKVGRQSARNIMQCDYDIDFEMPVTDEGEVDDTERVLRRPLTDEDWDNLAADLRKDAARMKEYAEGEWREWEH